MITKQPNISGTSDFPNSNANLPAITVVSACQKPSSMLTESLWSVQRQLYGAQQFVLVCGQGVDDSWSGYTEMLSYDRVVCEPPYNRYRAINKGIALATGDVVAFLDTAYYYAHARVLWVVAQVLSDDEVDACYGDVVVRCREGHYSPKRYGMLTFGKTGRILSPFPPYQTFFIKTRVYEELGGFRSDLGQNAGQELLERFFNRYGKRAVYIPHTFLVSIKDSRATATVSWMSRAKFSEQKSSPDAPGLSSTWREFRALLSEKPRRWGNKMVFASWLDADWPVPAMKSRWQEKRIEGDDLRLTEKVKEVQRLFKPLSRKQGIYVVTVNFNDNDAVKRLVQSLERCDIIEKLIVVDHSLCPTLKINASFPVEIIRQLNRGYGAGINRGLRAIERIHGIALVCNPDIEILTPERLPEAATALNEHPEWGCLVPAQVDDNSNTIPVCRRFYTWKALLQSRIGFMRKNPHVYRSEHFYLDRDLTQSFDAEWANASSLFLKLSLFPYPICFDERFFLYFEDVDICAQMRMHGYTIRYYPSVVVRHHERRESHRNLSFFGMHVLSLFRFIMKYGGLPQAIDLQCKRKAPLTRPCPDE